MTEHTRAVRTSRRPDLNFENEKNRAVLVVIVIVVVGVGFRTRNFPSGAN